MSTDIDNIFLECTKCGLTHILTEDLNFCVNCGTPCGTGTNDKTGEHQSHTCEKCGDIYPMSHKFCGKCGLPNPHQVETSEISNTTVPANNANIDVSTAELIHHEVSEHSAACNMNSCQMDQKNGVESRIIKETTQDNNDIKISKHGSTDEMKDEKIMGNNTKRDGKTDSVGDTYGEKPDKTDDKTSGNPVEADARKGTKAENNITDGKPEDDESKTEIAKNAGNSTESDDENLYNKAIAKIVDDSKNEKHNKVQNSSEGIAENPDNNKDGKHVKAEDNKDAVAQKADDSKGGKADDSKDQKAETTNQMIDDKPDESKEAAAQNADDNKNGKPDKTDEGKDGKAENINLMTDETPDKAENDREGRAENIDNNKDGKPDITDDSKERKTQNADDSKNGKPDKTDEGKDGKAENINLMTDETPDKAENDREERAENIDNNKDGKPDITDDSKERKTQNADDSKNGKPDKADCTKDGISQNDDQSTDKPPADKQCEKDDSTTDTGNREAPETEPYEQVFGAGVRSNCHKESSSASSNHINDNANISKEQAAEIQAQTQNNETDNNGNTSNKQTTESQENNTQQGKFYKKPNEAKPYVIGANTKKRDKDSKGQTNRNLQAKQMFGNASVKVHFHVLLPPSFKFNADENNVEIRSEHSCLGGDWNKPNERHCMKIARKLKNGYILLEYSVNINKTTLSKGSFIFYKYICVYGKDKAKYEFIYKDNGSSITDRYFNIPEKTLQQIDEWHIYDGIMHPPPESGFKNWVTSKLGLQHKKIVEEAKKGAKAMLPQWEGLCFHSDAKKAMAGNVLEEIVQVEHSLRPYLLKDDYKTTDPLIFKQALHEYIRPRLDKLKDLQSKNQYTSNPEETALILASAVTIVCICVRFELNYKQKDITKHLLFGLTLQPNNDKKTCCEYDELISHHFPDKIGKVSSHLEEFLSQMYSTSWYTKDFFETDWLRAMPLYHFLSNKSSPFVAINPSAKHRSPEWWGVTGIQKLVEKVKKANLTDKTDLKYYFRVLSPLFEVDQLLPRTLFAVLNFGHLEDCLQEHSTVDTVIYIANLYYHLKSNEWVQDHVLKILGEYLGYVHVKILEEHKNIGQSKIDIPKKVKKCSAECSIALDLMEEVLHKCKYTNLHVVVQAATQVLLDVVQKYRLVAGRCTDDTEHVDEIQTHVKALGDKLHSWLQDKLPVNMLNVYYSTYYSSTSMTDGNELKIFKWLLEINTNDEHLDEWWQKRFLQLLHHRLDKEYPASKKVVFFCQLDYKQYHPLIEDCFGKIAFNIIENDMDSIYRDCGFIFDTAAGSTGEKFRILLSSMFENAWPMNEDKHILIEHVLSWPSFARYYKAFYGKEQSLKLLSETAQSKMMIGVSLFDQLWNELKTGTIQINVLKLVLDRTNNFKEICEARDHNEKNIANPLAQQFQVIISCRQAELNKFQDLQHKIGGFLDLCKAIRKVDCSRLNDEVSRKVVHLQLNQICQPQIQEEPQPNITFFSVSESVLEILDNFNHIRQSVTFSKTWKQNGNTFVKERESEEEADDKISVDELVQNIWHRSLNRIQEFVRKLITGKLSFAEVDAIFNCFDERYEEMQQEVGYMFSGVGITDSTVNGVQVQRIEQIKEYNKLKTYKKGALIIKKIKDGFNLTGDFTVLDLLIKAGNDKQKTLKDLTKDVIDMGKVLKVVDIEKAHCINVFLNSTNLVKWLREFVKDTREIKVLVDLAMMSAQGQGDMNVAKVSCLHAAAVGYAPLIYELKPDAGFREFLHQCQQVWKSLETDPNLPTKLEDTARMLDWLKHVRDSHGSVEVDALTQAENINARGVYRVGCLDNVTASITKTLEDVLILKVPPEDPGGTQQWKEYDYEKLKDLQSKLMLVAGKAAQGKEQVDRFMEIFDGVTRLANTYTKLCKAGSILFKDWNVMFYCAPNRSVHTVVDFGLSDNTMKGTTVTCENVSVQINQLCDFMDHCLEQWQSDIEKQRERFYYLNYFTTEQLVILREEMAALCREDREEEICRKVYVMLSCVKHKCSEQDLKSAFHSAMVDLTTTVPIEEPYVDMAGAIDDKAESELTSFQLADTSQQNKETELAQDALLAHSFIEKLKEGGISEKMALKALQVPEIVGLDKIDTAIMWCLKHDCDDDINETETEMMNTTTTKIKLQSSATSSDSESSSPDSDTSSLLGTSVDPKPKKRDYTNVLHQDTLEDLTRGLLQDRVKDSSLKRQLESLWKDYLKTATVISVSDSLSVYHLGYILEHLADRPRECERPLPSFLVSGKPNLIVSPQSELMQTVLSVYMYENGSNLPLPTAGEVLLCTEQTRFEEIELLWRRAMGMYKQDKIFCLLNADRLDYEVSKKAEEKFEKLSKGITDYRLVVICSREREDKSNIVTAFERYRVKNPILYSKQDIQRYLHTHYQVNQSDIIPAAHIDPAKCSVRIIKSERAGVGKSLKAKRFVQQIKQVYKDLEPMYISLHRKNVDVSDVLKQLLKRTPHPSKPKPQLFHIDIAHEVQDGVNDLLFNLLVLGSLTDHLGYVWLRSDLDMYLIEAMPLCLKDNSTRGYGRVMLKSDDSIKYVHQLLHYLPSLMCWSPSQSLDILQRTQGNMEMKLTEYPEFQAHDQLMDMKEFQSLEWQRVFQYLNCYSANQNLDNVNANEPRGTCIECLNILLRYCGIHDPSWAELRHFVWFLNIQLQDCDNSSFCSFGAAEDLPGFKVFVVKSMIQMSRDFATRSLKISEQTPGFHHRIVQRDDNDDIELFQMKRQWETSPHPYAFFNHDRHSMTFLGFNIDQAGNMLDQRNNQLLERNVMPKPLQDALRRNRVPLNENFDVLQRHEKITKLCQVMGNEFPHDPDPTYVLTTDNTKKIMAIYMRFRCGIPVIIMGETGCGKTRLVKFMCDIQKPPGAEINNMVLMKVHGGTTEKDIMRKLNTALDLAKQNRQEFSRVDTVLFFDEANTTEEIGLIKQVMCDQNVLGAHKDGLRIVAACNPYRKHSDEMIKKLEQAGLGYHIEADQTSDKLGRIPMRRLVYRVQALPQSTLPLVWDFGQLNTDTEQSYIEQMVNKFITDGQLPRIGNLQTAVSKVLAASQNFMRLQKDECSFVSLRDVERTLNVMAWFYQHSEPLFEMMNDKTQKEIAETEGDIEEDIEQEIQNLEDVTRSLVLALGVCYHACLEKRAEYREYVAEYFNPPLNLPNGQETIQQEINRCQDVFLDQVKLDDNIARNQALKENVFMMVVCIELRIPLFLVGKPGSSKSLAKTIVADAMQGDASRKQLFKNFKMVHMVSYQCSPLSTPDGIVSTFRQCAALQKGKILDEFVSVVVLDEIGLAEDSPRMPLKTLHPLLEDGCEGDQKPKPHKKVAFIGISNWALDPAKMNRGILVQRGVPDDEELQESAEGICAQNGVVQNKVRPFLRPMAQAYLELYNSALKKREFFGLRDFYSIIKMVYNFSKRSGRPPTWFELKHAILRNFGGLDDVQPLDVFERHLVIKRNVDPIKGDPDCSPQGLIKACLFGEGLDGINSESRYLLILTENYAALKILQQQLLQLKDAIYIFGSSFPKDQEYTQVCRNINRIKICMETGQKIVLLNLDNLYESLYDALNQYYVYLGGQRFVDLGLGSHRVKCKVHEDFRLIVVAEKQVVYQKFPIPLINRLEKHTLTMETILTEEQQDLAEQLHRWAVAFAAVDMHGVRREQKFTAGDIFIGYDKDTTASIVLQVSKNLGEDASQIEILDESKHILLQCAAPEAIIRLKISELRHEEKRWTHVYFRQQQHTSLVQHLLCNLNQEQHTDDSHFLQVTTHSKLLSRADVYQIAKELGLGKTNIRMESLQEFDTEQQFCKQLCEYFSPTDDSSDKLLFIQCDSGDENATLIASAQYSILREYRNQRQVKEGKETVHVLHPGKRNVVFVIQLPRRPGGCFIGFQGGEWTSYHIDELRPSKESLPSFAKLNEQSLSTLFENALNLKQKSTISRNQSYLKETEDELMENQHVLSDTNEYEDMPLLEGYTEEDYIIMGLRKQRKDYTSEEHMDTNEDKRYFQDAPMGNFSTLDSHHEMEVRQEELMETNAPDELDIDSIIRSCIHGAAAMIEDDSEGQRKTHRVQLMLKLINRKNKDKSHLSFLHIVKNRVCVLLKDKEKTASTSEWAKQWLTNEAASQEAVTRAGTLVRSIWQNIEGKVTPLLAGIMAYCDASCNLDLLENTSNHEWLEQYWLDVFNAEAVSRLSYEDLQTASGRREIEKLLVVSHGNQSSSFNCKLPFSWIIKQQVDLLMHTQKKGQLQESDAISSPAIVNKLFNESELGQIINNTVGGESRDMYKDFVRLYISDYIRMVYKCQSSNQEVETKLIEEAIHIAAMEEWITSNYDEKADEPMDLSPTENLMTIPLVHKTFDSIHKRLQLFSQAAAAWPTSIESIEQFKNTENKLNLKTEFTLDIIMLYVMLQHLSPTSNEITQDASRLMWLKKVEKMRPVIETMLETVTFHVPGRHPYGETCIEFHKKCRCMWSRVCVLQMFIDHVCQQNDKENKLTIEKCITLWQALGENPDFKQVESLERIETFLKFCNKNATKHFFGDKIAACKVCEDPLTEPVKLPCKEKHVVCHNCIMTFIQMGQRQCPTCRQELPEKFKPQVEKLNKKAKQAYDQYKKKCNSFFMDIVSRLCFAGDKPPDAEVIQKLLGYITKESQNDPGEEGPMVTRQMLVLQDTIDPTPVVRSFLLQLLLRSHVGHVIDHLNQYFKKSRKILHEKSEHLIQLSLLFVYCMEDAHHSSYKQSTDELQANRQVRDILQRSTENMKRLGLSVEKLEAIAGARFGLHIVCEWLHKIFVSKERISHLQQIRKLFEKAEELCTGLQLKWPGLYLLRQLYRRFGVDTLIKVSEVPELQWILPDEARQTQNDLQPDRFVVCGESYKATREALTEALLACDMSKLDETMKQSKLSNTLKQRNLLLALYTEITLSHRHNEEHKKIKEDARNGAIVYVNECKLITQKELAAQLMNNNLSQNCKELTIRMKKSNVEECMITEAVVHFLVVLSNQPDSQFMQPFLTMLKNPNELANCWLPTMPLTETESVFDSGVTQNVTFYTCPNGHRYIIGECGRPAETSKCLTCKAQIGGTGHNPVAGNRKTNALINNQISVGHILGHANQRSRVPVPERELSPASVAILRFLMHAAMYLGANTDPEGISRVIIPAVNSNLVPQFLWEHMMVDVKVLSRAINRNFDDCILLVHTILDSLIRAKEKNPGHPPSLQTKESRQAWESSFATAYISPMLQGVEARMLTANKQLMEDNRLGNNPLLKILYEADLAKDTSNVNEMELAPALWNIRSRVTIEDLAQVLNETQVQSNQSSKDKKIQERYQVLKLFLKHEPFLRALRFLPHITRFQRLLVQKYHGAIDRAEATKITVADFIEKLPSGPIQEEYQKLVDAFSEAWSLIKEHISTFDYGGPRIPSEYSSVKINEDTPLAMLLPSWKGHGLCSIATVCFLSAKQNDFLENYGQFIKQSYSTQTSSSEATSAHLVYYHPEHDLLPMVLANTNYSLSVGQDTSHQYDFEGLQKQIEERLIKGKTLIKAEVETVVFRADFTNAGVFASLRKRIKQEPMDNTLQQQIVLESRHVTEINDSMAMLDIAIGFLVSGNYKPNIKLKEFLTETLEMKKLLHSSKAMHSCCLKHVQALWMLLSQERAKIHAKHGQDPFDNISENYQEHLTQEQIAALHAALQHTNVDMFMTELYECIMLHIAVPQDVTDPDFEDNREYPLGYVLNEYIEQREEIIHEDIMDETILPVLTDGLFPADVTLKHCVHTWREAYRLS